MVNIHHLLNFRFKNRFIQNLYNNLANWPFNPVAAIAAFQCGLWNEQEGSVTLFWSNIATDNEEGFLAQIKREYYRLPLLASPPAGFDLVIVPNVIIFVLRDIKGRIRSIVRRETAIQPSVGAKPGLARWKKMALPLFWILQRIFQSGINTMS